MHLQLLRRDERNISAAPEIFNAQNIKKIIIIYENAKDVIYYRKVFSNYEVVSCCIFDLERCYNIISAKSTDLCIFCCNKSVKNFYKILRFIAKIYGKRRLDLTTVLISSNRDKNFELHAYKNGADLFVNRHFDSRLVPRVEHVLRLRKRYMKDIEEQETFIAMVTHDLKSPLNASISAFNLIFNKQIENDTEKHEIITEIYGAVKSLKTMIDNVLTKSKLEQKGIQLYKSAFCLKQLTKRCIAQLEFLTKDKQQKMSLHSNMPNIPVYADEIELSRVLTNLISNSIEYAPKGSIIEIKIEQNSEDTIFSITNDSTDITYENPDEVFNSYMSYAKKYKRIGTGLGLFITKQIITAHGGTIDIQTTDRGLTTIRFTLPNPQI